ncbi:reverse transcriptase domain-containing protein [Tanacetum coccineum]
MAHELMSQIERQKDKVAENARNKRKWKGDHGGSSSQQRNKDHKVIRAHTAEPGNKKGYAGNLPLTPVPRSKQRPSVAKQKAEDTCYECGRLGHYNNGCPERKNQNQVNKKGK